MTTFYTIDRANERIADLDEMLVLLRGQREDLRAAKAEHDASASADDQQRLRLRIRGIVDQMQATVTRIDAWGIALRDIGTGLIDFPALANGRQIWLCWRLGEGPIEWWHELDSGFSGRRPLVELS